MNQIICDICGTAYPEGYDRCPTCSYPRQGGEKIVAAGAVTEVQTKVKGGRFSSKNVKKRLKQQKKAAEDVVIPEPETPVEEKEGNPNRPLWITIILLLVAIAMVGTYIGIRFGRGLGMFLPGQITAPATTVAPTETTVMPTVPCAAVTMDTTVIALDEMGQQHQLAIKVTPEDTTDVPQFHSADPAVAQVTEDGLVTAVGPGQTTVTITCGTIVRECTVVCWFQDETTVPTTPPETTKATEPPRATEPPKTNQPAELTLDQSDVSCFALNEVFNLYAKLGSESIGRSKITWSSSDDKVATVEKGKVVAVGAGTATITAEYQGKKATCIVRCRFEDQEPTEETKEQENKVASWKASHTDVSIVVGESFRLTVKNADGKTADAIWTQSTEGVVSVDGSTVTGRAPGTVTLTTTVDGVTLSCIVRVK